MASRPLVVAVLAMGLLVLSVGFEVVFHRSYAVDVQASDGWLTIGATGSEPYTLAKPGETSGGAVVQASRNDTLTFRLRVDNGYPWSHSEDYDVRVNGVIVAEGKLEADARSEGTSTFEVRAAVFFQGAAVEPARAPGVQFGYLDVQVGSAFVYASFQVQEVPS